MDQRAGGVLRDLRSRLAELYGQRLCGVYVFGSFARGEEDGESDIDVLVVLNEVEDYWSEVACTSDIVSELSLACGHSISCVFLSLLCWRQGETMFLHNVREEAIPA